MITNIKIEKYENWNLYQAILDWLIKQESGNTCLYKFTLGELCRRHDVIYNYDYIAFEVPEELLSLIILESSCNG